MTEQEQSGSGIPKIEARKTGRSPRPAKRRSTQLSGSPNRQNPGDQKTKKQIGGHLPKNQPDFSWNGEHSFV